MSAYIVEDETINTIVNFLANCEQEKKLWIILPLRKLGYDLLNPFQCKRLAEEMYTLNCDSIEQRYGEGEAEEMSGGQIFIYRNTPFSNRVQVLKSLACFLYQSCEGDCEETPLYEALERIKGILAYHIMIDLPVYDTAKWA